MGDAGSEARGLAQGLLGDTATRVLYNEPYEEAAGGGRVLGLSSVEVAQLPGLARGEGLWRVNERSFVVRHLLTPAELALFSTDARMLAEPAAMTATPRAPKALKTSSWRSCSEVWRWPGPPGSVAPGTSCSPGIRSLMAASLLGWRRWPTHWAPGGRGGAAGRLACPLLGRLHSRSFWPPPGRVVCLLLWRARGPGTTSDDPHRLPGLASRRQVTAAAGPKALLGKAQVLRPSLAKPRAGDVGFRLGRSRGVECWGCVRDSTVILGPPGAGKGLHLVVPMVLDAPGPLVTTSTRPDNLAVALATRARRGPVAVFDPQGLAPGVPSAARWSPLRGCDRPGPPWAGRSPWWATPARGTENSSFWAQQTVQAVRCLLHAGALGGKTALDLYRWSLSPAGAKYAVEVLGDDPRAATSWPRALDAIISAERRTRDSVWAMVANTFAPLADPTVLATVSPGPTVGFDPGGLPAG